MDIFDARKFGPAMCNEYQPKEDSFAIFPSKSKINDPTDSDKNHARMKISVRIVLEKEKIINNLLNKYHSVAHFTKKNRKK